MDRIYTVHNEYNSVNFLRITSALSAIFSYKVATEGIYDDARIHLTSRMGNPRECADFYE